METYNYRYSHRRKKRWPYFVTTVVFLLGFYIFWSISRKPLIQPSINIRALDHKSKPAKLAWPKHGEAAAGMVGSPLIQTYGKQKPVPTASTAKLITALVVLKKKPLGADEQGPLIKLTASDKAIYDKYFSEDGSLVKIRPGEKISEYQALQAMLLPSANNMADSLAIWAFGSLKTYARAANKYLQSHGLDGTHIGSDASGFMPDTKSTATDLIKAGVLAMQNPVLAQIVGQRTAKIPVAGKIQNRNLLLGTNNIIGIKTGNTDEAGGVFISASRFKVNNKPVIIITSVMGSHSLLKAMRNSIPLIVSAQANFKPVLVAKTGSIVATYALPWGGHVNAIAAKTMALRVWGGSEINMKANLEKLSAGSPENQIVGTLEIPSSGFNDQTSVPVKLAADLPKPSFWWKLTHPLN